ncbi:MAG: response regulator [Bacteroidia bacterium]|nr:response regulator [Bacteroidia bacterium]
MKKVITMPPPLLNIFIIDDNKADRDLMHYALDPIPEIGGISLAQTPDVIEEIDFFFNQNPDCQVIVFLDLHLMPFDGTVILNELRKRYPIGVLPVVCMSGHNDEQSWAEAYEADANTFWEKPMSLDQLNIELRSIIRFFSRDSFAFGSAQVIE